MTTPTNLQLSTITSFLSLPFLNVSLSRINSFAPAGLNPVARFGIPEDEPIQAGLISRGLENAQTKIEGFHFDARKRVLQYDDVLSTQRKAVYER